MIGKNPYRAPLQWQLRLSAHKTVSETRFQFLSRKVRAWQIRRKWTLWRTEKDEGWLRLYTRTTSGLPRVIFNTWCSQIYDTSKREHWRKYAKIIGADWLKKINNIQTNKQKKIDQNSTQFAGQMYYTFETNCASFLILEVVTKMYVSCKVDARQSSPKLRTAQTRRNALNFLLLLTSYWCYNSKNVSYFVSVDWYSRAFAIILLTTHTTVFAAVLYISIYESRTW